MEVGEGFVAVPANQHEAMVDIIVKARRLMNVPASGPFRGDGRQRRDLHDALKVLDDQSERATP